MTDQNRIEMILAEVIDDLYLAFKQDFVDYDARTHKLGRYKENVKQLFHIKLSSYFNAKINNN